MTSLSPADRLQNLRRAARAMGHFLREFKESEETALCDLQDGCGVDPKRWSENETRRSTALVQAGLDIAKKYGYGNGECCDDVASLLLDLEDECSKAGCGDWVEKHGLWSLTPWAGGPVGP